MGTVKNGNISHPSHYTQGGIECWDAIKAQMTQEEWYGYLRGNVVKYVWRWRDKNLAEDLGKAQVYLNKLRDEFVSRPIEKTEHEWYDAPEIDREDLAYHLSIEPFVEGDGRSIIRKVIEESNEAFSAWENLRDYYGRDDERDVDECPDGVYSLQYELVDTIQACCNMLAYLKTSRDMLEVTICAVHDKNEQRGRYRENRYIPLD